MSTAAAGSDLHRPEQEVAYAAAMLFATCPWFELTAGRTRSLGEESSSSVCMGLIIGTYTIVRKGECARIYGYGHPILSSPVETLYTASYCSPVMVITPKPLFRCQRPQRTTPKSQDETPSSSGSHIADANASEASFVVATPPDESFWASPFDVESAAALRRLSRTRVQSALWTTLSGLCASKRASVRSRSSACTALCVFRSAGRQDDVVSGQQLL